MIDQEDGKVSRWLLLVLLAAVAIVTASGLWTSERPDRFEPAGPTPGSLTEAPAARGLPPQALTTLESIARGGPFQYDRDGTVFQNREGLLPQKPSGYYREYTVETPGSRDRGARRIVTGGDPPEVYYYTDDHYRSFRRIEGP
ncbi:MAG TPA: ribonuclease domain-containing protein [Steroidobacteraceae bacterium]|nr:ribonuclease domain-containing protein [Steroidobacteraceae bacterium]